MAGSARDEHWDRGRWDFSGKTDPQIIRELLHQDIGRERCEERLSEAVRIYLGELERRLTPAPSSPSRGFPSCSSGSPRTRR
jgi:hypothetical protein